MRYLDLFAGYGGFSLGIQQSYERIQGNVGTQLTDTKSEQTESEIQQWRERSTMEEGYSVLPTNERREWAVCIGFSEIDKYAIQVYKHKFPTHKHYGDITTINAKELPDFDLLTGGFPCQAFSIAGKRLGFEDTRGTLIYDVFRIIKEKHPRYVLLENVKGLLSHDHGNTFKTIITSLAELGYAVEWQVLNAKNFGVPQNRERVFIIGHLGGFGGSKVFPIGETNESNIQQTKKLPVQICNTLRTNYSSGYSNETYVSTDEQDSQEGGDKPDNSNSIRRTPYSDGMRIRRLTPTECERLMGLPDGWTEGVSDTQRYKLCGNGVVVNVVQAIIEKLFI